MASIKISPALKNDLSSVCHSFPSLRFKITQPIIEIWGNLPIVDSTGHTWANYAVMIIVSHKPTIFGIPYPYSFPIMYELGEKIPKTPDRHINNDDSCCVCVEPDQRIEISKGITISHFIKQYAIPFLANQTYYELKGNWANGDYLHGVAGILQRLFELTATQNPEQTLNAIMLALGYERLKINSPCFCNSRIAYHKCHLEYVQKLSQIGQLKLVQYLAIIKRHSHQYP